MSAGGVLLVPAIRLPEDYGRLEEFKRLLTEVGVAGFIVFGGDTELTPPFLRTLRQSVSRPILILADYERGAGAMVPGMPELPPAMAIGATGSRELAYLAGKITALSARAMSVNVVLAPVLDVLTWPGNPIVGCRAFSDDPGMVARLGAAFIEGVQEEGVIACAKHFPGHGDTVIDSHADLPRVAAELSVLMERELPPFRRAVEVGVGMLMTAHVVYDGLDPGVAASFSRLVVTDLLKKEWGYRGLVITDALMMEGAAKGADDPALAALAAGADLLLYPDDPWATAEVIDRALADGRITERAISLRLGKIALAGGDQIHDAPVKRDLDQDYAYRIDRIARQAVTLGDDPDGLLPRLRDGRPDTIALVVDEDSLERRSRLLDSYDLLFPAGVVHVTPDGPGAAGDLAGRLREAEIIVLFLLSDIRAWKGGAGLSPSLAGFAGEVLATHGEKTLTCVLGSPHLAGGLPVRGSVFAYADSDLLLNAVLDGIFTDRGLPGHLPVTVGERLPRGTGRGRRP